MNAHDTMKASGEIKWFDPAKGFGFVVADTGGPDILLHANVLRNFGQGSIADGSRVTIEVQKTDRGLQALEIFEIVPPEDDGSPVLGDMEHVTPEEIADMELFPARVKWFDKAKGFGFANVFGDGRDVFLHIEVLRRSGMADLTTGEAVGLRWIDGDRGLLAVEITPWELAAR